MRQLRTPSRAREEAGFALGITRRPVIRHDRRGSLGINCRPPDRCLTRPEVIDLVYIVWRLGKCCSGLQGSRRPASFGLHNAAPFFQNHPRGAVMMVPPRAVTRLKNQRLNLNVAGPGARRKRETVDPPGDRMLKAECKRSGRQCYGEPG